MDYSLYIHIPFCISKCAYCDFFSKPVNGIPDSYIDALCREIEYRISYYKAQTLETIYIGGGTPSLLSTEQFRKILSKIKACVKIPDDAEITVEVNPDDVSNKLLQSFADSGVTRVSCGIQSMNDQVLKRACRRADASMNLRALECFGKHWKGELSVDLISGLPGESEESLLAGLKTICAESPAHISLYSLTIEENTPFGKQLADNKLNYDFDEADRLWLSGRDYLEGRGYSWYEVSNFCRPGKECVHNLRYWNHKNYLGCGSGACGTVYSAGGEGFRWTNTTDIASYISWWLSSRSQADVSKPQLSSDFPEPPQTSELIDLPTSQFEFFMMGLRKIQGVKEQDFKMIFNSPFPEEFLALFEKWQKAGLCLRGVDGAYAMSRKGMLFLNKFLEELC